MEAVAAFGLAGTVLQFIDSGSRFVTLARSFYNHGADNTNDDSHLLLITQSLTAILPALSSSESDYAEEHGLTQLATECSKTAGRLITVLQSIRNPKLIRKRDAVRAAFRRMCKEDEIQSLQEQLSSFRDQLNLHLLLSLREYASKSSAQQEEIVKQLGILQSNLHVGGVAEAVLDYFASKEIRLVEHVLSKEEAQQIRAHETECLRLMLVGTLCDGDTGEGEYRLDPIDLSPARYEKVLSIFLSSFHYEGMMDRESRVVTAHDSTFRWVSRTSRLTNKSQEAGHGQTFGSG